MANIPAELKYTKSHEWLKEEDGLVVVGLTDFAANALGDIVFINLPQVGDEVTAGESFADVYSPVSGRVAEINEALLDAPERVNQDPYGAWFIKIEGAAGAEELLDAAAYEAVCAAEEEA